MFAFSFKGNARLLYYLSFLEWGLHFAANYKQQITLLQQAKDEVIT